MRSGLFESIRFASMLGVATTVAVCQLHAQTAAALGLRTYAGLTIAGRVGDVYSIEFLTNLGPADSANAWRCLEFLQLSTNPQLWIDTAIPATGQRFYRAVLFAPPSNTTFIPPGTFRMGSPQHELDRGEYEDPQMRVTISRGFWMGSHEVTQGEYSGVMGTNPSWFSGLPRHPVERVSWHDATSYCARLTERERAAGRIATNSLYRLPTEAEWEYACRAGTSTRFSHGDDPEYTELGRYAWYEGNSGRMTHPVGEKLPNPWGLHDMHGNVREWCLDWFDTYPGGIAVDPQGPRSGVYRVFRGGQWQDVARRGRSADRSCSSPDSGNFDIGFRVVLVPGQP